MEEWKTINNFPEYEVSSLGRVKSLKWNKERILKPYMTKDGYGLVDLRNNRRLTQYIHRFVAEAFIPRVEGKNYVDHINHITTDNRVENLRWVTNSENCLNKRSRQVR